MQINDLTMHYNNHTTSSAESMTGTKGIERLESTVRDLAVGNIFEGTVNAVKNGQVVLGLSNGSELMARLDAGMQIEPGASMFFQVKSNDGETIAIRPYTVDGNGANLTLVNALKAANLAVSDRFLNMANSMMQEQMPIDKNSLSQMARILMANPDMNVQTLVQMKKLDIPITSQMVAQFEKYMDSQNAVHSAIDDFINQLPQILSNGEFSTEQLKAFDSQFLNILAEGLEGMADGLNQENGLNQTGDILQGDASAQIGGNVQNGDASQAGELIQDGKLSQAGEIIQNGELSQVGELAQNDGVLQAGELAQGGEVSQAGELVQSGEASQIGEAVQNGELLQTGDFSQNVETSQAGELLQNMEASQSETLAQTNPQVSEESLAAEDAIAKKNTENLVVKEPLRNDAFGKLTDTQKEQLLASIKQHIGEFGATKDDTAASLLQKISARLLEGQQITKTDISKLFSDKNVESFLKNVLEQQLLLNPKDAEKGEKIQKLYEQMDSKMTKLDTLMQNLGMKDTAINQTMADIRGNVEFMNQMNQAYTYVQIPLKMSNQNATAQLYVYTNKKELSDPDRELTAFLHLDLDHLGATDVSVRMHRKEVNTKFYMESDESYDLVKQFLPQLEERLRNKGYNCTIEIENEGKKVNFVEDFLKKDAPSAGQLHRYSFDVRA